MEASEYIKERIRKLEIEKQNRMEKWNEGYLLGRVGCPIGSINPENLFNNDFIDGYYKGLSLGNPKDLDDKSFN